MIENDTPFDVYGWTINQFPPAITEPGGYADQTTPLVTLENSSSNLFPPTAVYPYSPGGVFVDDRVAPYGTFHYNFGGAQFWNVTSGNGVWFKLNNPYGVPIKIQLDMAVVGIQGQGDIVFDIYLNGARFEKGIKQDHNLNWHAVEFDLDPSWLVTNVPNTLEIRVWGTGAWIRSATFSSNNVPLSASYFWKSMDQGIAYPDAPSHFSKATTKGVDVTDSETTSFAQSLGIEVSTGGIGDFLASLNAKLSASFTWTQSQTHTVSIQKATTTTVTRDFLCNEKGEKSQTYQIWQLVFQFDSGGKVLRQNPISQLLLRQYREVV